MRNRTRILLLALATVTLTTVAVLSADDWYRHQTVITFATGPDGTPESRFAHKLSDVLRQNHSSVRLSVVPMESRAHALAAFARREADLAIVRTDDRKLPSLARSLAVLEHEALLLIGPKRSKIKTLAEIQGKTVAVIGRDARNEAFLRQVLQQHKFDFSKTDIRTYPPGSDLSVLLNGPADLVVMFYPLSRLGNPEFEWLIHAAPKGFALLPLSDAKALQRKIPGLYAETLEAGLISSVPPIPEDEMETVALQKLLVVRRSLPDQHVVELMRALFENGRQLAVENIFATSIEPPDTDQGALIAAHDGANQYVDHEVKTFFDRYSDLIYIAMSVASVLASLSVALYGTVFRSRPPQASDHTAQLIQLARHMRETTEPADLDLAEVAMEELFERVLLGLADRSISSHGLDAFRLAHDAARDALAAARARLSPRHQG